MSTVGINGQPPDNLKAAWGQGSMKEKPGGAGFLRNELIGVGLFGDRPNFRGLWALGAILHLVLHLLSLFERLITFHLNGREMREHFGAAIAGYNKPIPFAGVKPFYGSYCHTHDPPSTAARNILGPRALLRLRKSPCRSAVSS